MAPASNEKMIKWTSRSIKRLRGKRTLVEFGATLGAPKNTVWRWEAGKSQPDERYTKRLSDLAKRERFLADWKLVGSMKLIGDLESANAEIREMFRKSIERSAPDLGR